MVVELKNKRALIWDFDPEIKDVSKLKDDNLFIKDEKGNVIWRMNDVIKIHDTAVNLTINDKSFIFITFNGLSIGIDIDTLKVIEKKVTK